MDDSVHNEPYRAVNDQLVDIFERLLGIAEKLSCLPNANWTEGLLSKLNDELLTTLTKSPEEVYRKHEGAKRTC